MFTMPNFTMPNVAAPSFAFGTMGNDSIMPFSDTAMLGKADNVRPSVTTNTDYIVFGFGGDEAIITASGNDTIFAGAGNDVLNGGMGDDVLWGGQGADIFQFEWLYPSRGAGLETGGVDYGNRDKIQDFEQGTDLIDVRGWQNTNSGTGQEVFVGKGLVGAVGLDLMVFYQYEGGSTIVTLARHELSDGGGGLFMQTEIELRGTYALTESDFIF